MDPKYRPTVRNFVRICKMLLIPMLIASFIIFCVFLGFAVNRRVYQNEYGIIKNSISTKLKGPFTQGVYNNFDIGDYFYKYTATIQYMNFDDSMHPTVSCITSDGLTLQLEVDIQYQYKQNDLIPVIWYMFGDEDKYQYFLARNAYGVIYDKCALFSSIDYYSARNLIENSLFDAMISQFNNKTLGSEISTVQLKNIVFPQSFTNAIAQKQHLVQDIQTQLNNRTSILINANTSLIQAQQLAQINIINAYNDANITISNGYAIANSTMIQFDKLFNSLNAVRLSSDMNETQYIDFVKSQLLQYSTIVLNS